MAFIKIEGFAGNIYIPETNQGRKKHPCRDCYSCGFCSDERCELCLKKSSRKGKILTDADSMKDC
jgi:hypothetical protein